MVSAVACGCVLLAAAVLKLVGWNVSPFAQYGWLLSPTVQSFAVIWEVLLGVWLLSRKAPFVSWLAAVFTFAAFALVSGYLGVIGQATCGCFGIIQASPWAAFAVDVTALGLLAIGRPPLSNRAEVSSVLTWAGGLATIFAVLAVAGVLTFGSLDAALARLRGQSLSVSPVMLDFGSGKPGEVRTGAYSVRNNTSALVRLMGRTSDCNCLVGGEFPVEIPPGQSVTLTLDIRVPRSVPGQFTREVDVYTDLPQASRLTLLLTCLVERPE